MDLVSNGDKGRGTIGEVDLVSNGDKGSETIGEVDLVSNGDKGRETIGDVDKEGKQSCTVSVTQEPTRQYF